VTVLVVTSVLFMCSVCNIDVDNDSTTPVFIAVVCECVQLNDVWKQDRVDQKRREPAWELRTSLPCLVDDKIVSS